MVHLLQKPVVLVAAASGLTGGGRMGGTSSHVAGTAAVLQVPSAWHTTVGLPVRLYPGWHCTVHVRPASRLMQVSGQVPYCPMSVEGLVVQRTAKEAYYSMTCVVSSSAGSVGWYVDVTRCQFAPPCVRTPWQCGVLAHDSRLLVAS